MRLLTAKQTAELLQVALPRVYELARQNLIPCVRMGRQLRFDENALREWAARGGKVASDVQTDSVAA
jgi:excisionase family DNA binding protein